MLSKWDPGSLDHTTATSTRLSVLSITHEVWVALIGFDKVDCWLRLGVIFSATTGELPRSSQRAAQLRQRQAHWRHDFIPPVESILTPTTET